MSHACPPHLVTFAPPHSGGDVSAPAGVRDSSLWRFRLSKVRAVASCPFAETLYLDNDIRLWNATRALGWFDSMNASVLVSGLAAPVPVPRGHETSQVPLNFPEVNGGTLYCRCPAAKPIFRLWEHGMHSDTSKDGHDQMALRLALWAHREQFQLLPSGGATHKLVCRHRLDGNCVGVWHVSRDQTAAAIQNSSSTLYDAVRTQQT
jgi:hypothetical protein